MTNIVIDETTCSLCKGTGYSNGKNKSDCSECLGLGVIVKLAHPERRKLMSKAFDNNSINILKIAMSKNSDEIRYNKNKVIELAAEIKKHNKLISHFENGNLEITNSIDILKNKR